ncbi:hypothetical protein BT67DRAFT_433275 [Trichocladium antarcticum]|uniref:Copper acquisition factor BIM1-like domain-containing protein n=1 Tax=Trichocladium antarcticum TaxID=1450529 RepID=A0AAN6UN02_9PEZI|nr:hypothetical protein BT67DRAFT_433275 [Trichocladium antarcticum]
MIIPAFLLLGVAQLAQAHFGVDYPPMRYNTLGSSKNTTYSQYTNPCAGVPGNLSTAPRTDWPLTGGSLQLDLHHHWTYLFINLGLGPDVSNFNYTLTAPFWNVTGNGTLCVPKLALPADLPVRDGSRGSIQVVTVGDDGSALYNCADVTFRAGAKELDAGKCETSAGVSYAPVVAPVVEGPKSGAEARGVGVGVLAGVMGVTVAMVFGMGV